MGQHQKPNLSKINAVENASTACMLELDKMISYSDEDERPGVEPSGGNSTFNNTTITDIDDIKGSNLIMCFGNHAHKLHSLPHQRKCILYFNFTGVLPGVSATHAELKLYKERSTMQHGSHYLIEIFLIRRRTNTEDNSLQSEANLTVSKSYEGWLSMNVTDAAQYWTVNRDENFGLYLRVTDVEMGQYIDADMSGIVVDDGPQSKRIVMISYFKKPSEDHAWYAHSERKLRNISPTEEVIPEANNTRDFWEFHLTKQPSSLYSANKACRRHEMYVNFTGLGWNSWIIAPQGYHAYYCAGECRFPLPDHMNPTVHAILQTIVHDTDAANTPKVCCVPTKLAPLSILYYDNGTVRQQDYQNMIVEACGCR